MIQLISLFILLAIPILRFGVSLATRMKGDNKSYGYVADVLTLISVYVVYYYAGIIGLLKTAL